jgi:hypothetical protein
LRVVAFSLAALMVLLLPVAAQVSARLDGSLGSHYVWHGITRASDLTAQTSLATGVRFRRVFTLEGGAVRHYELHHVDSSDVTEAGIGAGPVGEDDLWGRLAWDPGPVRLQAGVVRYLFRGDPQRRGVGSEWNTTEFYAAVTTPSTSINRSVEAWLDLDRAPGWFFRAAASVPVLVWPYRPLVFPLVDWEVGLNLRHRPNPSQTGQFVNFARPGFTHAGMGLTVEVRPVAPPFVVAFGVRGQVGFDDATRASGMGRQSDFIAWVWLGATVVWGGAARELR